MEKLHGKGYANTATFFLLDLESSRVYLIE